MRTLWVLLLLIPLAQGQVEVLTDPSGDPSASTAGTAPAPTDTAPFDLLNLQVSEDADDFHFALAVSSIDQDNPTPNDSGRYLIDFRHADQPYRIQVQRQVTIDGRVDHDAYLYDFDPGRGTYVRDERLDLDVDHAGSIYTAHVAREQLIDGNGTAPTIGRSLDAFRVYAGNQGIGINPVSVNDAMPDSGTGDIPYEVSFGLAQKGHASLRSEQPMRASNGEKGTFVFYVQATNSADDEGRFDLSTTAVPEGWEVTLPAATLRIDGNRTLTFPVLVSVPFNHQHGAVESFVLRMDSQRDDSQGQVQLGIRYLAVPQPAGHHDWLHLHSRTTDDERAPFEPGTSTVAYMNTVEDDERDEGVPVEPYEGAFSCCGQWRWDILLEPGLEIGLDFDTGRQGYFTADFGADANIDGVTLTGSLWHLAGGEQRDDGRIVGAVETQLASLVEGTPASIGSNSNLEAVIQPTNASDLIPYEKGAALLLQIELRSDQPGGQVPAVVPRLLGGQMQLPLNEYRDRVEGVFNSLAGLSFRHDNNPDRLVNPGETVLFNLTLGNNGAVDDVFALRINGTNADWARILGDQKILVTTGNERRVAVAVTPPADAADGDIIDLIVTAVSEAEPTLQGNIRVVATVDSVLDHPDDSRYIQGVEDELTSKKKSPGLPVVAVVAALALFAQWRRNLP